MIRTPQEALEYVREVVRKNRFVARDWRMTTDQEFLFLEVSFTFMCPCGTDFRERVAFPSPDHPDGMNEFDYLVRCAAKAMVRELEQHLTGEVE